MKLSNKVRFILAVIAGTLVISNRRRADIEDAMDQADFDRISQSRKVPSLLSTCDPGLSFVLPLFPENYLCSLGL